VNSIKTFQPVIPIYQPLIKRHFPLPGGCSSNIVYLWFGIRREISHLPKESGQEEGKENGITTWNVWAFLEVILRVPLFLETARTNQSLKRELLLLVSEISKRSGVVQVS
jgi:hypothetical protein